MSTPEDTPSPEKKPEAAPAPAPAEKPAPAAEKTQAAPAGDKPAVAKPKFKVTRSPFAPKIEGGVPGAASKPGPVTLPKDGGAPKPTAPRAPAPNPVAKAVSTAAAPAPKPAAGSPKPMAPVSARKAAEMAEEEDAKFSPALMAVDAIAAIVAIAFGVLIVMGMKG